MQMTHALASIVAAASIAVATPTHAPVTTPAYVSCPTSPQTCIDHKQFTLYHGNILAGHDWAGYAWVAQLKTGTRVHVPAGPVAGDYEVFGHLFVARHGGSMPNFRGASLILQSCQGDGTAFSLLKRV